MLHVSPCMSTDDTEYRQRQHDVYTGAQASHAKQQLRWVRQLAREGSYSFNDVRRARREYLRARANAPRVWRWAPDTAEDYGQRAA